MTMQFLTFTALLAVLALAGARDTTKFMKTVPTISNSLVNLGKMEISLHFNGKHQELPYMADQKSDYYQPAVEESCPCNNFKPPSFLSDPTEIVNKILKSNDLFKDPTSTICCESSEHMQESSVVFELNPNNVPSFSAPKPSNNLRILPNMLRAPIFPSFMPLSPAGGKQKTVDIFMLPTKKNDMKFDIESFFKPGKLPFSNFNKKNKEITAAKSESQVFKDGVQQPSSVKKDLTLLENKTPETTEVTKEELHTDAPPVTSVMNAL